MWDEREAFPDEILARMASVGLLGISAPEEFGGSGADTVSVALAVEEVSAADATCGLIVSAANSLTVYVLMKYGTDEQKKQLLPRAVSGDLLSCFAISESASGSDASKMRTTAAKVGDHYVVNGSKQFITFGSAAKMCFLFAMTDASAGSRGITCFMVPTETRGYEIVRREKKLGIRASDTCQLAFDELAVDAAQILGKPGQGYKIALDALSASRIGIAAQATGISRAALNASVEYAKTRQTFGQPLIDHQAIGFMLADMATAVEASHQLTVHAAACRDAGFDYARVSAMAKLFAATTAEKVCSKAIQVHGGYGYLADYPVERFYRDARVCQIYEGTNEMLRIVISRSLAK
jgi:alkylation response protein AidB-like acyl-CoA dehydrogenase